MAPKAAAPGSRRRASSRPERGLEVEDRRDLTIHRARPNRREEFVGIPKSRHALRQRGHGRTRWYHVFAATDMAISATHADAWAFDAELGKAFKLAGTHVVR